MLYSNFLSRQMFFFLFYSIKISTTKVRIDVVKSCKMDNDSFAFNPAKVKDSADKSLLLKA